MADIAYRLKRFDFTEGELRGEIPPNKMCHRFVAVDTGRGVDFYGGYCRSHLLLSQGLKLVETDIVGGGYVLADEQTLVVEGSSDRYGAVPKEVAERLGRLILPKVKKILERKLEVSAKPTGRLNAYWTKNGFGENRVLGRGIRIGHRQRGNL